MILKILIILVMLSKGIFAEVNHNKVYIALIGGLAKLAEVSGKRLPIAEEHIRIKSDSKVTLRTKTAKTVGFKFGYKIKQYLNLELNISTLYAKYHCLIINDKFFPDKRIHGDISIHTLDARILYEDYKLEKISNIYPMIGLGVGINKVVNKMSSNTGIIRETKKQEYLPLIEAVIGVGYKITNKLSANLYYLYSVTKKSKALNTNIYYCQYLLSMRYILN